MTAPKVATATLALILTAATLVYSSSNIGATRIAGADAQNTVPHLMMSYNINIGN